MKIFGVFIPGIANKLLVYLLNDDVKLVTLSGSAGTENIIGDRCGSG